MIISEIEKKKPVEGRLLIEKYFPDGSTEKVFEQDNLIVLSSRQAILNTLYSTPVLISTITCVSKTVTATTSLNHGLTTGNTVVITGVSPSDYNGTFQIAVVNSNTFTYTALNVISVSGTGSVLYAYPVPTPDPIYALNIGIGGGIDSRAIPNCSISITQSTITSGSAGFLITDIGQSITIPGAGPGGSVLNAVITSYVSPTSVIILTSAYTTVTNVSVTIGQGLFPKQENPLATSLVSQVASLPVIYTVDLTTPSVTFIADATQATANGMLLTEAGLFKLSGAMFNVKNHPGIPKTSDFGVHYVWTVKYA